MEIQKAKQIVAQGLAFQGFMPKPKEPTIGDYLFAWGIRFPNINGMTVETWMGHLNKGNRKPITDDPWLFIPDNCGYAGYFEGWWTRDGTHLFCPGCGLDCT